MAKITRAVTFATMKLWPAVNLFLRWAAKPMLPLEAPLLTVRKRLQMTISLLQQRSLILREALKTSKQCACFVLMKRRRSLFVKSASAAIPALFNLTVPPLF